MTIDELNVRLAPLSEASAICMSLADAGDDQITTDVLRAMSAIALRLQLWTKVVPLGEAPPDNPRLWFSLGQPNEVENLLPRLDEIIDDVANPVLVGRLADFLWWGLDGSHRDFHRHAERGLKAHVEAEAATLNPTQGLLECWAGNQLARSIRREETSEHFIRRAVERAFDLIFADYSPELVGLRIDEGLGYFYGVVSETKPLTVAREAIAIAEIAEKRLLRLPFELIRPPAVDWIHRLRFVAAGSNEDEQVRVVKELCAQRRKGIADWSKRIGSGGLPVMELAELSSAIENAASVSASLKGRTQRKQLDDLTREMVVELQRLDWKPPHPKRSLVNDEDLTADARAAFETWTKNAQAPTDSAAEMIRFLRGHVCPLEMPTGLERAAADKRPNVSRFRSTSGALGFLIPDTLAGVVGLDEIAFAEVARSRIELWGRYVSECLHRVSSARLEPAWFDGPFVRRDVGQRFAEALRLFFAEDFDAAAHVLVPRLEAVIRRIAIGYDIPALQIAYRSLGRIDYLPSLLDAFAEAVPPSAAWWKYMRLLLVDRYGAGLRNVLSHGLRSDLGFSETVSREEAAALIHAALFLSGVTERRRP